MWNKKLSELSQGIRGNYYARVFTVVRSRFCFVCGGGFLCWRVRVCLLLVGGG